MCDPREASDDHGQVRGMFYRSTSHPPTIVTIVLGRVVHALALADERVTVPMMEGMRSLNVAVAGAMVLGEALRQTGAFPLPA